MIQRTLFCSRNRTWCAQEPPCTFQEKPGKHLKTHRCRGWRTRVPHVILAMNGHLENFDLLTRAPNADECVRLYGEARWALTPADPLGATVRGISGSDEDVIRNRFTLAPLMKADDA